MVVFSLSFIFTKRNRMIVISKKMMMRWNNREKELQMIPVTVVQTTGDTENDITDD